MKSRLEQPHADGAALPTATGPIITMRGLTKVYGGRRPFRAVDELDLDVRPGEIFGLLGPNGAGKTTTIGMLTTRVIPSAGAARVAGVDVVQQPAVVKQRIGVVAQTNTLDRSVDVRENLYYHGRFFGFGRAESRRRADALLERFRLTEKADALVDTLSGGMAQRLMVARALLHDPAVLFLDEPTTGLDPQSRIALWDLLRDYHGGGQTILITTHYMEEADRLCDRVAIMDHGRILALGTPAELKRTVGADRVIRLTPADAEAALEPLATRLGALDGVLRSDVHDGDVRVVADGRAGLLPRLVLEAEAVGCGVADVSVTDPTLETVFIAFTGRDLRE